MQKSSESDKPNSCVPELAIEDMLLALLTERVEMSLGSFTLVGNAAYLMDVKTVLPHT